jgi:hypothetical protein
MRVCRCVEGETGGHGGADLRRTDFHLGQYCSMRLMDRVSRILRLSGAFRVGRSFIRGSKSFVIPLSADMLCKSLLRTSVQLNPLCLNLFLTFNTFSRPAHSQNDASSCIEMPSRSRPTLGHPRNDERTYDCGVQFRPLAFSLLYYEFSEFFSDIFRFTCARPGYSTCRKMESPASTTSHCVPYRYLQMEREVPLLPAICAGPEVKVLKRRGLICRATSRLASRCARLRYCDDYSHPKSNLTACFGASPGRNSVPPESGLQAHSDMSELPQT